MLPGRDPEFPFRPGSKEIGNDPERTGAGPAFGGDRRRIARMSTYDLLIIGGGINGAGIARDAAGRGLSVALCDKGDIGGATSSASTKLIHGGLRYLEHGAFGLVAEALAERERLLTAAPHLVRPMRFVLPRHRGQRPAWMLRLGLFLYDRLGGASNLGNSQSVRLDGGEYGAGLEARFRKGFLYWDCWADDARLVVATLRAAGALGAHVLPRTACVAARRETTHWLVRLHDQARGRDVDVAARVIVNAAGPWAEPVARDVLKCDPDIDLVLVKGSHIVVPRLYQGEHALVLQAPDRRVVFAIPFEDDYSLVGTTEVTHETMDKPVEITTDEVSYLCGVVNRYLARPLTADDVCWSFAGVRPLIDDGKLESRALSREYRLDLDVPANAAPMLAVYGGKLTTFRRLAERAVDKLVPLFPRMGGPWTDAAALPGGQIPNRDLDLFPGGVGRQWPWIPARHLAALAYRHGSLVGALLGEARTMADLGRDFGAGLYERELAWFRDHEWAMTAEDALFRRSKCGLHLNPAERDAVARWLAGFAGP